MDGDKKFWTLKRFIFVAASLFLLAEAISGCGGGDRWGDHSEEEFPLSEVAVPIEARRDADPSPLTLDPEDEVEPPPDPLFVRTTEELRDSLQVIHRKLYDISKYKTVTYGDVNVGGDTMRELVMLQIELRKLEELERIADAVERISRR